MGDLPHIGVHAVLLKRAGSPTVAVFADEGIDFGLLVSDSRVENLDTRLALGLNLLEAPGRHRQTSPAQDTRWISEEQWSRAVDINLLGCVRACCALLPKMAVLGSASVVNIASDLAKQRSPV